MWYSIHDKNSLMSYGVFLQPTENIPDTQIELEWSSDPGISGEWIKPIKNPETGEIYLYEDTELKPTVLLRRLRTKRDTLLFQSDWTQLRDTPLAQEQCEKWRVYRQALRDLPGNTTDLENVVWPESP